MNNDFCLLFGATLMSQTLCLKEAKRLVCEINNVVLHYPLNGIIELDWVTKNYN